MNQKFVPKLVRDNIPEIIQSSGRSCQWHRADIPEYSVRLHDKMCEELTEFMEDPGVEEAADMYEVFLSLLSNWDIDFCDVVFRANDKKKERGGFRERIVLDVIS